MKKKLYFIILFISIGLLLSIGLIFKLSFKYWIWSVGGLAWYIWCKDAFTGTKWVEKSKPNPKNHNTALATMTDDEYKQYVEENYPPISEQEKNGYVTLMKLCIAPKKQNELISFFENLKDFSKDEDYMTTLNYVMEYSDEQGLFFIMALDYKQNIETLAWRLRNSLLINFGLSLDLPKSENFVKEASVSYNNIFEDFDKPLREKGFQIGFIDTQSAEYVIFVHKIKEKGKVENAVNEIGYKYYEKHYPDFIE